MSEVTGDKRQRNRPRRTSLLLLSLMAALLAACAATVPGTGFGAGKMENYTSLDHSFTVLTPRGWTLEENQHPYGDLTKISGVRLTSPVSADEAPATITVRHYSGEHLFRTPDEFIHNALNSIVRTDYDRDAPITDIKIAGRPGKAFQIRTFELIYLPQSGKLSMPEGVVYELVPPHRQIDMLEQYLVVPASQGYFVLGYRSPVKTVENYQGLFAKLLASFHPQIP